MEQNLQLLSAQGDKVCANKNHHNPFISVAQPLLISAHPSEVLLASWLCRMCSALPTSLLWLTTQLSSLLYSVQCLQLLTTKVLSGVGWRVRCPTIATERPSWQLGYSRNPASINAAALTVLKFPAAICCVLERGHNSATCTPAAVSASCLVPLKPAPDQHPQWSSLRRPRQ